MEESMEGFIYILVNPAFPNLVKIGRTTRDPQERAIELSSTGVPEKFVVVHSVKTNDCIELENRIHQDLHAKRYNQNREFFEISVSDAIKKIDFLIGIENEQQISEISDEKEIEVCLYHAEIDFCRSSRIGLLAWNSSHSIPCGNGVMIGNQVDYLYSDEFKRNLVVYYDEIEYGMPRASSFNPIKVHKHRVFKILPSFMRALENVISEHIQDIRIKNLDHFEVTDSKVLLDGVTIVLNPRYIGLCNENDFDYLLFPDEKEWVDFEKNTFDNLLFTPIFNKIMDKIALLKSERLNLARRLSEERIRSKLDMLSINKNI